MSSQPSKHLALPHTQRKKLLFFYTAIIRTGTCASLGGGGGLLTFGRLRRNGGISE